jgi:phospho-N-acetylmuramoyl-pentapeptide-transferase
MALHLKVDGASLFILAITLASGLLGGLDDYLIIVKKSNEGLRPKHKILGQLLIGLGAALVLYLRGTSALYVPWYGYFELGFLYVPFMLFVYVALTNAVNLTDGLDGLNASVSGVSLLFLATVGALSGQGDLAATAMMLAGGVLAFFTFNRHPAKIFMGDLGAFALGGALFSLAAELGVTLLIPVFGIIFVSEALSVVLQVAYYKKTGRRIFRMSPLHHHFELGGWHEKKVVAIFALVTVVGSVLSLWLLAR